MVNTFSIRIKEVIRMRRFIKLILALGLLLGLTLPLSQASAQDDYIYGVPVENLGNRTYERPAVDLGYNPDSFQLDANSKTLYTQGISYYVNFEQIPTQTSNFSLPTLKKESGPFMLTLG